MRTRACEKRESGKQPLSVKYSTVGFGAGSREHIPGVMLPVIVYLNLTLSYEILLQKHNFPHISFGKRMSDGSFISNFSNFDEISPACYNQWLQFFTSEYAAVVRLNKCRNCDSSQQY